MYFPDHGSSEPQTHALIIGVGGYPHIADGAHPNSDVTTQFGELKQITSAPRTAARLAEWMVGHAANWDAPLGSVDLLLSPAPADHFIPPTQYDLTPLDNPTFQNIQNAFLAWKQRCDRNPDNIALFYFCGHGGQKRESLYLLCQDFGASPANIWDGSFDFTRARDAFHACKATRQFFFIDACRVMTLGLLLHEPSPRQLLQSRPDTDPDCRYNFTQFAAPRNESAVGPTSGISYYAQSLMNALDGAAAKKIAGRWVVRTGQLVENLEAIARMLDLPDGYDPNFGRETSESATVLRVPATPSVQVTIACSQEQANRLARLACQKLGMPANQWPYSHDGAPWTLELPAEIHTVKAEFTAQYQEKTESFAPQPPAEFIPLEVSE